MSLSLILLIIGFFLYPQPNSEIFFGVSIVLFGVLSFAGIALESLEPVYNSTLSIYVIEPILHIDYSLMGINLMFFAIAILFFFMDVFEKYGRKKRTDA